MADEKYISIEYNKWRDYYKPLEKRYDELLKKHIELESKTTEQMVKELIEKYKEDNHLLVRIVTHTGTDGYGNQRPSIISHIMMDDAAYYLAEKKYNDKMKAVPNWIKKLFKL